MIQRKHLETLLHIYIFSLALFCSSVNGPALHGPDDHILQKKSVMHNDRIIALN